MRHVIKVENLSKQYQIGTRPFHYPTLRDRIADVVQTPLTRLRNGNNVSTPSTIWALKDVSFAVQPGEVVGVVGRNGQVSQLCYAYSRESLNLRSVLRKSMAVRQASWRLGRGFIRN